MTTTMTSQLLGSQIREARERQGLTQRELAERIHVTSTYICKIEKGHAVPPDKICVRLASELGLDGVKTRELRAAALQEQGIDVGDVCPHAKDAMKSAEGAGRLDPYQRRVVEALRSLDDEWKERIVELILWAQARAMREKRNGS